MPSPGRRALGVDLGTKRIGIAISPHDASVAVPYEVLQRSGKHAQDHRALAGMVADVAAEVVVIGLPVSLDGSEGPAAVAARAEIEEIAAVLGPDIEVALVDERFTTVTAERLLAGMSGKARRKVVDKVAAAVILQTWLDSQ